MKKLLFLLLAGLLLGCNLEQVAPTNPKQIDHSLTALNWVEDTTGIINATYDIQLKLENEDGMPVPGILLHAEVTLGDGTVSGGLTNPQGIAVISWTTGEDFGDQQISVGVDTALIQAGPLTFDLSTDHFMDDRDGKVYGAVNLNGKWWMSENLNFSSLGVCYENQLTNCDEFGRLYNWEEVTQKNITDFYTEPIQGICPDGWRLPTDLDLDALENQFPDYYDLMCCPELWDSSFLSEILIKNSASFNLKPAGEQFGSFAGLGQRAYFWSSTKSGSLDWTIGYFCLLTDDGVYCYGSSNSTYYDNNSNDNFRKPCRCIKL